MIAFDLDVDLLDVPTLTAVGVASTQARGEMDANVVLSLITTDGKHLLFRFPAAGLSEVIDAMRIVRHDMRPDE